jgi:hypothetical protein
VLDSIASICRIQGRYVWRTSTVTCVLLAAFISGPTAFGQENSGAAADPPPVSSSIDSPEVTPKRIFGIVPNYRTTPTLREYTPISPREKFKLASQDSFDRGAVALGVFFGAQNQLTNSTPSFGHGASGFARYSATSYSDFVIANFMTEGIYPVLLHQDPRYFRRGSGSGRSRLGAAIGQIFWTRTDSGGTQFNFSEIIGSSTAVAISNAYYPDNRNVSDAATRLVIQIGVDMTANILKEFAPELNRLFSRKHREKNH